MSSEEAFYFEVLNDYTVAKTPQDKERYLARLQALAPHREIRMVEVEVHKCLADPIHFALLSIIELKDFKNDPSWIQARLLKDYSVADIEKALERLIGLGFIRESGATLEKTHSNVTNQWDVANKTVQAYHRNILAHASDAIEPTPVDSREYNSHSLTVRTRDIPAAKERIQEFVRKFIAEFEASDQSGDQVYQMSVQLFPLTQNPKGDRK